MNRRLKHLYLQKDPQKWNLLRNNNKDKVRKKCNRKKLNKVMNKL